MAMREQDKTDTEVSGADGSPVSLRTLYYDRNDDREVHLAVTADRMHAYLKITPGPAFTGLTYDAIKAILTNAGVVHGVIDAGLSLFGATQTSHTPYGGYFEVARGDPMRRGEDGSIEFHVQPTSFQPRYDENDSGGIDYRQLNLIENCFAGQRVASILPAGPGRPGTNVFGEEIPPEPGTSMAVQPGPGVVVSANGRDFTSEIEGRVVYQDGVLSVSPILEILRDIDYSVGNVDFVGKVSVKGSLLDGFYINAKHGVEIQGDMGAARITSEGDVKIVGGIKGKNAAIITCRSLTAHYIDDATVEASGDVAATKEILNSDVKSLGRVSIPNGAIVGGAVCGFKGIDVETIGSDIGVATWVMAGLNWTEENKKEDIRAQVAEYLDRVHSSKVLLDPLLADKEVTSRLGADQKSMLSELISELRDIRDNLSELLDERSRIVNRRQEGMVNQINVRKTVFMGVNVKFSQAEGEIKDSVKGPVSITQDTSAKGIRLGSQSPLPSLRKEEGGEEKGEAT